GLVSSKRKWQRPPNSWAIPKLSAIALGWPRWRYPFGSGGKRVTTSETLPSRTSAATISRMKSRRSGEAGSRALTRLLLVISIRVMQYVPRPRAVQAAEDPADVLVGNEPVLGVGRRAFLVLAGVHGVGRFAGQHGEPFPAAAGARASAASSTCCISGRGRRLGFWCQAATVRTAIPRWAAKASLLI